MAEEGCIPDFKAKNLECNSLLIKNNNTDILFVNNFSELKLNRSLIPETDNTIDLGSSDLGFRNIYVSSTPTENNHVATKEYVDNNSGGGGGGGGSSLTIQDEGSSLATYATIINFTGDGVIASGTSSTKTITINGLTSFINPQVIPNQLTASKIELLSSTYNNNHISPFSDAIHFNTGLDPTFGNQNLLMLRKDTFGIRLYQDVFGSAAAYSSYKDVVLAENNGDVILTGNLIGNVIGNITGNLSGTVNGNVNGNVTGRVSDIGNHDTDDLTEGAGNLYFTNTRAQLAISVNDTGGDGSLSYNSGTGVITYTGPSATETINHLSGGTGVSLDSNGVISIGQSVGTGDNVSFTQVTSNLIGNVTGNVTGTVSDISNHSINGLSDVDTTTVSPNSGQALVWNSTNWVPGDTASAISNLTDVDLTGLVNNSVLKYDNTSTNWIIGSNSTANATANAIVPFAVGSVGFDQYQNVTVGFGSGCTITTNSTGDYSISFNTTQLNTKYSVMFNAAGYTDLTEVEISNKTTSGFDMNGYDSNGNPRGQRIDFVCYAENPTQELTADITTIDDLGDVDTTTVAPADGQVLAWNNSSSKWNPKDDNITEVIEFGLGVVKPGSSFKVDGISGNGMLFFTSNGSSFTNPPIIVSDTAINYLINNDLANNNEFTFGYQNVSVSNSFPVYLIYDALESIVLTNYKMWPRTNGQHFPLIWKLEASNDPNFGTFTELDSQDITSSYNIGTISSSYTATPLDNPSYGGKINRYLNKYRYYRLNITSKDNNYNNDEISIGELVFYKKADEAYSQNSGKILKMSDSGTGLELGEINKVGFEMIKTSYTTGTANANNYIRYDSVQFEIGGSGTSTSTGLYTVPSDGLYHFNIDFTVDNGDGNDDSIGVGFQIANNSYYNQTVGTASPFRINPRYDTASSIEHSYSFGKTARLSQGATIGFYITDWNGTSTRLQGAHFSGFKI